MQRLLLVNASLLLLALLLAGLVWISTEQQNKEQKIPLTALTPEQINLIVIENSSGHTLRLERKADGWMMTQPSRAKANDAIIENLLQITQTRSIRSFKVPQDLTEFGLNPPHAVLTLNQTRIEVGTLHPMNQRRYLLTGNLIHLTNDRFAHLLKAEPHFFISATDTTPH